MAYDELSSYILKNIKQLSEAVSMAQYEKYPELKSRYGEKGFEKTVRDTEYNLKYLAESVAASSQHLFYEYVLWMRTTLESYNVSYDDFKNNLIIIQEILNDKLKHKDNETLKKYIEVAKNLSYEQPSGSMSFIQTEAYLGELASKYLALLLKGNRHDALSLITDAVELGVSVRDLYLHVFQPSQYETGRLWQLNKISVAHEHLCTASTQYIMSQLYPHIFSSDKKGCRMVASCVGGELHEIGLRMVADFFEMDGWDTFFLGSNTPVNDIIRMVDDLEADLIAISATMSYYLGEVKGLIDALKDHSFKKPLKIIVGGYPFNTDKELWRFVRADGYCPNAQIAVDFANNLMNY